MDELLIPISTDEFENKVTIRFNNILNGFDSFKNFTIDASNMKNSENKLIEFVEKVFQENNYEAYVDFYINKISDKDKERLLSLIPANDKEILKLHLDTVHHDGVFYKLLNKNLIPFLVRLNTREIFFVTFYFTYKPITIWGNYSMKFPCFFERQKVLNYYYYTAKSIGLLD